MTYCVAAALEDGLVFASDSRTNAGVDHINTYCKMHAFCWEGERVFVLLSAGNLATTQAVTHRLTRDLDQPDAPMNLRKARDMHEAADYVGEVSAQTQKRQESLAGASANFSATFILGGQIGRADPDLLLIYPEGNYIHYSPERPFLQVGETKYGKPVLDRLITWDLSLPAAARCILVSLDGTMRSNLTVGPPIDLLVYTRNSLTIQRRLRYKANSSTLSSLRKHWNEGLKKAFLDLPPFDWEKTG
ncbi:MAG: peptidase [Magnetococcales bacterium]|nr:peptidase [Magnetococcales bacterium]